MKKFLNISVIAALAILPLAANATVPDSDPGATTADAPVAANDPKYPLAQSDGSDNIVATASYVKGAYNAAIKAINKVATTADSAVKTVKVNGTTLTPTDGAVDVLVGESTTNGAIKVNNQDVAVHGLKSAAYAETTAFDAAGAADTAEQNAKDYADGLASNYDAAGSATAAETAAKAYADSLASNYDAAGAASTAKADIEGKLDDGANGYDIDAKTLKVGGQDVLTNAALTNYATKTGVETTVSNALAGTKVDISGLDVTNGALGGSATASVPVVATWGATASTGNVNATVDLTSVTTNVALTGDTTPISVTPGTATYPANP